MKRPILCVFGVDTFPNDKFTSQDTMQIYCQRNVYTKQQLDHLNPDVIIAIGVQSPIADIICPTLNDLTLPLVIKSYITTPKTPLFTVFTPSYKSGAKIQRPFRSLQCQTCTLWEWIIINDSPEDVDNCQLLKTLEEQDNRIKIYSPTSNMANIGSHKYSASMLGRGDYLLELDHDDDLTPDCLEKVANAFKEYPEAGFAYTDFSELYENQKPFKYGLWGYNFGAYYSKMTQIPGSNKKVLTWIAKSLNINPYTIRNIIGVPNHVRVWRRSIYLQLGHRALAVGDDYELLVRTFLITRFVRIPCLGYYQYRNDSGNTTFKRNQLIQIVQNTAREVYEPDIEKRLQELNCNKIPGYNTGIPVWCQNIEEQHCTMIAWLPGKTVAILDNYQKVMKKCSDYQYIIFIGNSFNFLNEIAQFINNDNVVWWNLPDSSSLEDKRRYARLISSTKDLTILEN